MSGGARRVLLVAPEDGVTAALRAALDAALGTGREAVPTALPETRPAAVLSPTDPDLASKLASPTAGACVVLRPPVDARRGGPDLDAAAVALAACAAARPARVVLLASAAVIEPRHDHPGLVEESRSLAPRTNAIARAWAELERLAHQHLAGREGAPAVPLLILRPAPLASREAPELHARRLGRGLVPSAAGFDPSLQLLAVEDLAEAVCRAVVSDVTGTFFVAPAGTVPLRSAIRLAGGRRLPIPYEVQDLARRLRGAPAGELAWTRYPATVSGAAAKEALGFVPRATSAEAVAAAFRPARKRAPSFDGYGYDGYGLDANYIAAYGRTLFRFLHRVYWRIETRGLEHVPREGAAVLVGVHRGFMPFDGVMALHTLVQGVGRIPRFLVHPTLVKFPFLAPYMTKLGGIVACHENADRVLGRGELLGVYPEGIQGAFTFYRDAYRLGRSWRDDYVRMALRHRAPIVPFVTVGSAEIYPILGKIEWRWWRRVSEWPFLPITPTPVPLPTKWHTLFLPPIAAHEGHPAEAADDPEVVRGVSREVKARIEEAMAWMLARRRSIFHGSVFTGDDEEEAGGYPLHAASPAGRRPGR